MVTLTRESYRRCPNADIKSKADRETWYVRRWADIYLKDALARLGPQMVGYDLTIEDVYTLQQMCAYEVRTISFFLAHYPSEGDADCCCCCFGVAVDFGVFDCGGVRCGGLDGRDRVLTVL